ncbi:MAG: cation:proton antiporter [Candidatus Methanofastidiosia archaeon]
MFSANLLIVLIVALFGRLLSKKIRQPSILGELIVGMVIGNLGIITLTRTMEDVADIGILFLLFAAGLSTNFEEFKRVGKSSTVVAFSGVILPFLLGYFVTSFFGYSSILALFIGVSLVATSVGVNTEILIESNTIKTKVGTVILTAAVIDDVIGIIVAGMVAAIVLTGSVAINMILETVFLSAFFLIVSLTLVVKLFKRFSKKIIKIKSNADILLLGLIIALLLGVIAENMGMSIITGAFIAGLIIGQTHVSRLLLEHVSLFGESLFIPIFFVTIGMQFDISAISSLGLFTFALITVAIIGKIVGCGIGARISNFTGRESFAIGVAMIPRAGVELVLVKIGLEYGIISSEIASVILTMVIVTTLITPPMLSYILKKLKVED